LIDGGERLFGNGGGCEERQTGAQKPSPGVRQGVRWLRGSLLCRWRRE
jgi:hypothetical protein